MIAGMRFPAVLLTSLGIAAGVACGTFGEGDSGLGPASDARAGSPLRRRGRARARAGAVSDVAAADGSIPVCAHTFCADFETDPFDAVFTPPHVMTSPVIELS